MSAALLVPIDFSEVTDRLLLHAQRLAQALEAHVLLLHVLPDPQFLNLRAAPEVLRQRLAEEFKAEARALSERAEQLKAQGLAVTSQMKRGRAVDAILEQARTHAVDYVIMGARGHSALYEAIMGSVTAEVLRRAPCPVLVVPAASGKAA